MYYLEARSLLSVEAAIESRPATDLEKDPMPGEKQNGPAEDHRVSLSLASIPNYLLSKIMYYSQYRFICKTLYSTTLLC